jgi:hypothetical protein
LDIGILLGVTFLGGRTAALSEARRNPCLIIAEPAPGLEIVAVGLLATLVPAARRAGSDCGPRFWGSLHCRHFEAVAGVGLPRRGWLGVA